MFYYYSIIAKPLTTVRLRNESCPVCSKNNCIEVTLYMRYTSFIIPFFGMGRTTSVHCTECDHEIKSLNTGVFAKKNYSPEILNAIKDIKTNHKRTLWQLLYPWSVFILIGLLIIFGLFRQYFLKNTEKHNEELINNPKVGDIYKVNIDSMYLLNPNTMTSKTSQTLFKIYGIKNDTLFMVRNKQKKEGMGFNESDWNTFSREDNAFETIPYRISSKAIVERKEIFEFFDQKKIDSIKRTDVIKSTNPFHFSKSIGQIPNFNGIEVVERK